MVKYILEINMFYDWLDTNQLPKSAIALWHALMHIGNKARWPDRFAVAISTIESKTGFKRSELFKARNVLAQKGRIDWKERGGNQSAEYSIIYFSVHNTDASADANVSAINSSVHNTDANGNANGNTNRTQVRTQTVTINKTNTRDRVRQDSSGTSVPGAADADAVNAKTSDSKDGSGKRKKGSAQKKKEDATPHWNALGEAWTKFYAEKHDGQEPTFWGKGGGEARSALVSIMARLRSQTAASANTKDKEWTEEYAVYVFVHFLKRAYSDKWRAQNFRLPVLSSHYDSIVNPNGQSNSKTGETGVLNADHKRDLVQRVARASGQGG